MKRHGTKNKHEMDKWNKPDIKGVKAARNPWTSFKQFKTCQYSYQLKERIQSNI